MKLNKLLLQDRHKWTTNILFGRKRRSTQVWTDPTLKYSGYCMLLYSWLIFWMLSSYSSSLQHKPSKTAFIFKWKGGRRILSDVSFKRNRFSTDCGAINRMWVSISKTLDHITMVKVKLSHHGPRYAPRTPKGWGSQDFQTVGTGRWKGCQPYAPAAFTNMEDSRHSFLLDNEATSGSQCGRKD